MLRDVPTPFVPVVTAIALCACAPHATAVAAGAACDGTDDSTTARACTVIDGDLVLDQADDDELAELGGLRRITGSLLIRQSPRLTTLDGLDDLERVDGDFHLITTPALADLSGLDGLETVGGELHFVEPGVDICQIEALVDRLDGVSPQAVTVGMLPDDANRCRTVESRRSDTSSSHPIDRLPELDEMRRGELLEGVHPELVDRIRLMYALLEQEGIEIEFVSGYRPHKTFYDAENRLASWHNLGMAVDLNLAHRNGLEDARKHYDGEDADQWERIGEIASGLGIIWGEWFDDIFHFEWHPDYHARIREHEFEQFQQLAGDDLEDYRKVWQLFEDGTVEDDADDCSGGCHVVPDDGLRQLLEYLRPLPPPGSVCN